MKICNARNALIAVMFPTLGSLVGSFAVPSSASLRRQSATRIRPFSAHDPSSQHAGDLSRVLASRPATLSMASLPGFGSAAAGRAGAAAAALLLRGGGAEQNVIAGVLAELANIRTPAALLGGAALGTMFVGPKPAGNRRLHLLYTVLSTSAFALQLICVLCSTLTYTSVASRSEAIAASAIGYLSDKMQFEFYVIRASFVYGLFSFLGALMTRAWLTFSADGEQGSARVITAILGASMIFLLNFIHYTHNPLTLCLGGMTKRLFWLTLGNMYGTKKRFFRHVVWFAGVWAGVKLLKLGPNQGVNQGVQKSG